MKQSNFVKTFKKLLLIVEDKIRLFVPIEIPAVLMCKFIIVVWKLLERSINSLSYSKRLFSHVTPITNKSVSQLYRYV
jgi:hypothetical protein